MILIYFADGFEEMEALAPIDILRRAGKEVVLVGVGGKSIRGAHNVYINTDITSSEADYKNAELVILPGGGPGYDNLDKSEDVDKAVNYCYNNNIRLAAICAAPMILGKRNVLKGRKATCFPGFEEYLSGAVFTGDGVVTDGLVTTAKSAGWAVDFGLELVKNLISEEAAEKVRNAMFPQ